MLQKRIVSYNVDYYAGIKSSEKHFMARIILYGEENTSIGELYFHRHSNTILDEDYVPESRVIMCYF